MKKSRILAVIGFVFLLLPILPTVAQKSSTTLTSFDPSRGLWTLEGDTQLYYGAAGDLPLFCDWVKKLTAKVDDLGAQPRDPGWKG